MTWLRRVERGVSMAVFCIVALLAVSATLLDALTDGKPTFSYAFAALVYIVVADMLWRWHRRR